MQPIFHIFLLAALAVAMVTSAPLTNQEKLVNVEQTGEAVDRAKRADEEIVFGNQQNKARVVSKKSDLSNIIAPPISPGERDQGSEVIVHKEIPVNEDLAARAEAATGSASEHEEKMKEAVEAAIQSVAEDEKIEAEKAEAEKVEAETSGQETGEVAHSDKTITDQIVDEDIEEGEQGTGEASDVAEEKIEEEDEDEALRNLQKGTVGAVRFEGGDENEISPEGKDDEVRKFLQEKQDEAGDNVLDRDREAFFYEDRMRNYLMSLAGGQNLQSIRPFLSRFRRSLHRSKNPHAPKKTHHGRRIKRDLLDDTYYGQYDLQPSFYTPEDIDDALISSPDEPSPLSDEEAEYLNKKLIDYLTNNYDADQEEPDLDESPLDSYLSGYEEAQNEPYNPYSIYDEDNVPIVSNPYEVRYPYIPIDFDSYQNYAKRGMIDYYPQEEKEKRYFFPFSKEPETHWGAFVPEKRDYGEAIQRLQRLAMALSDNPGPYYREMLEEYQRK